MNYYKLGLQTKVSHLVPQHPIIGRVTDFYDGGSMFVRSGARFYGREPGYDIVGAQTGGPIGGMFDAFINLFLDGIHILLLIAGGIMLWRAVAG